MVMEIIIGVFGFILTILGTLIMSYFKSMSKDMESMSQNMIEMNIKLEKVITDQSWHKEEMTEIMNRDWRNRRDGYEERLTSASRGIRRRR